MASGRLQGCSNCCCVAVGALEGSSSVPSPGATLGTCCQRLIVSEHLCVCFPSATANSSERRGSDSER